MWAERILAAADDDPPCVLFHQEMTRDERQRIYGKRNGRMLWLYYDAAPSVRVEQHLAAASLEVLLDLYRLTGHDRYADAVRRVVPYIVAANADPEVEMPAMFLTKYRGVTGDTSFDGEIMSQIEGGEAAEVDRLVLLSPATHERNAARSGRMGWRQDSVRWGYQEDDGTIARDAGPSPSALMLGYAISNDLGLATRALAVARRRMELATFVLRDGRDHGCAAHSIHAVAAGHGRATGAGCVTTTLYPFALGSYRYCASECPRVRFADGEGIMGLPDGVAARCWLDAGALRIALCNASAEPANLGITSPQGEPVFASACIDGIQTELLADESVRVSVPPEACAQVDIERGGR
jgi:hypothetical protein